MVRRYQAVLFDLVTALVDSWSLWNRVAGNADDGTRWRAAYLRNTYGAGAYRPYATLVAEAAEEAGCRDRWLMTSRPVMVSWSPGRKRRLFYML
jgi:hypothetical protein